MDKNKALDLYSESEAYEEAEKEYDRETDEAYVSNMLAVKTSADEVRYDELYDAGAPRSRFFSVASLVIGIVSVLLSFTGWWVIIAGVVAVLIGLCSRKNLKYFDGLSIAGIIFGIFGIVFGAGVIFVMYGPFADVVKTFFTR